MLKIHGAHVLFREQENRIYPDLKLPKLDVVNEICRWQKNLNLAFDFCICIRFKYKFIDIYILCFAVYVVLSAIWPLNLIFPCSVSVVTASAAVLTPDVEAFRETEIWHWARGWRLYNGSWKPKEGPCLVAWPVFQSLPIKPRKLTSAIILKIACNPAAQTAGRGRKISWHRL